MLSKKPNLLKHNKNSITKFYLGSTSKTRKTYSNHKASFKNKLKALNYQITMG